MPLDDSIAPAPPAAAGAAADRRRWRRVLLWGLLIGLLAVAQALLVALVLVYEDTRAQDRTDRVAAASAAELRQHLLRSLQTLQILVWSERSPQQWRAATADLLGARPELVRVELRDAAFGIQDAVQAPHLATLFGVIPRLSQSLEAQAACDDARRSGSPAYSRSYFAPLVGGGGMELMDLCVALDGDAGGMLVATFSLQELLEAALVSDPERAHELSLVEGDGARLARAGTARGAGVYRAERLVDLPGA